MVSNKASVSLAFKSKMRQDNLVPFGRNIQGRVGTNPLFTAFAALANTNLDAALDTYETKLSEAVKGGTEKTALKNKAKDKVIEVLSTIALEVDIVADGDETVILAAGYQVRGRGERHEEGPEPVTELVALPTLTEGEVNFKWKKGDRANKTAFEWAEDMEVLAWQNGNYADGSKLLITNLPSKKWIQVKARSLGTFNRNSPWCEPVRVFVY